MDVSASHVVIHYTCYQILLGAPENAQQIVTLYLSFIKLLINTRYTIITTVIVRYTWGRAWALAWG